MLAFIPTRTDTTLDQSQKAEKSMISPLPCRFATGKRLPTSLWTSDMVDGELQVRGLYFACCVLCLCTGTIYLFPVYSSRVQEHFDLSVTELSVIGSSINAGGWTGLFSGLCYDRFGSVPTAFIASVLLFSGYFGFAMTIFHSESESFQKLCFFGFCFGQGNAFSLSSSLMLAVKSAPARVRGRAVGLFECFFSLSTGLLSQFFVLFFSSANSIGNFFVFLSIFIPSCMMLQLFSLTEPVMHQSGSTNNIKYETAVISMLTLLTRIAVTLIILISISTLIPASSFSTIPRYVIIILFISLILLASYHSLMIGLSLVNKFRYYEHIDHSSHLPDVNDDVNDDDDDVIVELTSSSSSSAAAKDICDYQVSILNHSSILECIATSQFWIIFTIGCISVGVGISILDNLPEFGMTLMSESQYTSDLSITWSIALSSIFSSCSGFARLFVARLSDHESPLSSSHNFLTRPKLLSIDMICLSSSLLILLTVISFHNDVDVQLPQVISLVNMTTINEPIVHSHSDQLPWLLIVSVALIGLAYGGIWSILPGLQLDIFGPKVYGVVHGVMNSASAIGSFFIYTILSSSLVDMYKSDSGSTHGHCVGRPQCFQWLLTISIILVLFCGWLASLLQKLYLK